MHHSSNGPLLGCFLVALSATTVILSLLFLTWHGRGLLSSSGSEADRQHAVEWCHSFTQTEAPICGVKSRR